MQAQLRIFTFQIREIYFGHLGLKWQIVTEETGHRDAWSNGVAFSWGVATQKNAVFWDVAPGGSCKNRRFEGT
jgi:hypothetical protein